MASTEVINEVKCYHCGLPCEDALWLNDKAFCCFGCKTVFEILNENDLCEYYNLDKNPGIYQRQVSEENYAYLDEKDIRKKVIEFDSTDFAKVRFYIPAIHCVSCIWLLESMQKLDRGILKSEVNFCEKTVCIEFDPQKVKLGSIAKLLSTLGYTPQTNLEHNNGKPAKKDNSLVLKLAIAGFCFGNVMLFSFPEYLGLDKGDQNLMRIFTWLNLLLSVPVFFYSGSDYFRSAFKSFKQERINIDVPIAAGLLALFSRSAFDIVTETGPGYLDSFTGLVFFLLIGRWFQSKTYESLAFDRDFKAYFPLAVNRLLKDEWKPVIIYELKKGDQIRIRNMEIIPADSILLDEQAYIDYSFVTGESKPVKAKRDDLVYAGGRLTGTPVILVVDKKTSQSHLTTLWNNEAFRKVTESKYQKTIDKTARIFTWIVMFIALATAIYWQNNNPSQMWLILTSVLMVACPCALALAAPFTYGSMLRVFGENQLYLKNADVIERMANIDAIVFDKTGTVTHGHTPEVVLHGQLTETELSIVKTLTGYSTHPLSTLIYKSLKFIYPGSVTDFKEIPGKGLYGVYNNNKIKIGSASYVKYYDQSDNAASRVYISINDNIQGYFSIRTSIRKNIKKMVSQLGHKCNAILSGDNDADKTLMSEIFSSHVRLLFNQTPYDKLNYIKILQQQKRNVLTIGDGLNDAGALKQSDVGIAVTDDTGVFTPACDGILNGEKLYLLNKYLELAKSSSIILKTGFAISFFYNALTLGFAVTGHLTPLVAAILMPISSISVVVFSSVAVNLIAKRKFK